MAEDPYMMDTPTRLENARKLDAWLDDNIAPGHPAIGVLIMALADRLVEQAPDVQSLSVMIDGSCRILQEATLKLFPNGGL